MTKDEQIEMEKLKADLKTWQDAYADIWKKYQMLLQLASIYLEIDVDGLKRSIESTESTH
jgi:hypothetical protein